MVTTFGLKSNMCSPMVQAEAVLDDLFKQWSLSWSPLSGLVFCTNAAHLRLYQWTV